jgi:hypothetical protein
MKLDFQEKKKIENERYHFFWKRLIWIRKENNIHKYESTIPKKTRQPNSQKKIKNWQILDANMIAFRLGCRHDHAAWNKRQSISKLQGKLTKKKKEQQLVLSTVAFNTHTHTCVCVCVCVRISFRVYAI